MAEARVGLLRHKKVMMKCPGHVVGTGLLRGHRKFLSKKPERPTGRWADNIKTALVYRENEVLNLFNLLRT